MKSTKELIEWLENIHLSECTELVGADEWRDIRNYLGAFEQIKWERDVAINQLAQLGYELGEKPRNNMTFTELCEMQMKDSWSFVKAAPCGLITSREQYDYMVAYSEKTNFDFYIKGFYGTPTYEECYDRYLNMESFFGGASFYFTITDLYHEYVNGRLIAVPKKWDYGKYGKIDLEN